MLYKYLKIDIIDTDMFSIITEDMIEYGTGLKTQTINNSLKKLEKEGLIKIEYNKTSNLNLIEAIKRQDYDAINKYFEIN